MLEYYQKKVNDKRIEEHNLIRKLSKGFNQTDKDSLDKVEKEIRDMNCIFLQEMKKSQQERLQKVEEKIQEHSNQLEKIKEEKKQARAEMGITPGRKQQGNSYTSLIMKSLMDEQLNNINKVVEQVNKDKPGRELGKIEQQTKSIIRLVTQQKEQRWQKYNWDDTKFILTLK